MKRSSLIEHENGINLLIGDRVWQFDKAGRPTGCGLPGKYIARRLDGSMVEKNWPSAQDVFSRHVKQLDKEEQMALLSGLRDDIEQARHLNCFGQLTVTRFNAGNSTDPAPALDTVDRFLQRRVADEQEFKKLYNPITILPPDQYFPIVVQITEGCPWNQCGFCNFYRDRTFRIRTEGQIFQHTVGVRDFLGAGASYRRSIFLGDANAVVMPYAALLKTIKFICETFPDASASGIYSFGDVTAIMGKSEQEWKQLAESGLRRIYVGVESGSQAVRQHMKKLGSSELALQALTRLKNAGLAVGIMILLGYGDEALDHSHVSETAALLKKLPLDRKDVIYFSPLRHGDHDLHTEHKTRMKRQYHAFQQAYPKTQNQQAMRALYDVREFVY